MGYQLSCGVLNVQDSDYETAISLGLELVTEKPFSPISMENHQRHLKTIESAEQVILGDVAIGAGNQLNLQAALAATMMGKPVYLFRSKQEFDFVGGDANKTKQKIIDQGGIEIANQAELFPLLEKLKGKRCIVK